jgi:hypothetical protein
MIHRMVCLTVTLSILACAANLASSAEETLRVSDLRCEYLIDPVGIDVPQPRFGWQLKASDLAARGLSQSAYRVLVAGSEEALQADRGDLWDSGQVNSDNSTHVVYQGKPLASGTLCFWKVRVWDESGRMSPWSKPAKWSMGLLAPSDWKAQWIGVAPETGRPKNDPWFRKSFSLNGRPTRATVYVASLGYHELYINGKTVGDSVLAPSISDLSQRVRYVAYDVSDALHDGKNAIALWAAPGWADFPEFKVKDKPLVLAQLDVIGPNGRSVQVVTDATWKTHPSPLSPIGPWAQFCYGGESYDAARELPGWNSADLDDSAWKSATVFSPQVRLSAEMIEPTRRIETLKPVAVASPGPGVCRIDMGRNFSGWLEVHLKGRAGQKATLEFAERPTESVTYGQTSEYVFGPTGEGVFCHRFNYAVSRWITIRGLESTPHADDVRAYLVTTDCRRASRFECSNPLMNRIYETTLWTFRSLSVGGFTVDCPHRERCGYGGDAHATMEAAMMNFSLGAFYTKWLEDWRDVQRPDGDLPYTAPTRVGGGGPAWSGICITLPWQVYLHYGDRRILEQCYPTMQRWIAFLNTKAKNNLLQPWGGIWDFLGDWVPPGKGQMPGERVDDRSTLLFNNCYYLDNVTTIANIAKLLGKADDAAAYRKQAAAIAETVQREFFHRDTNTYACGEQLYEALPLLVGVTPKALQPAVLKRLEQEIVVRKQGHLDTGIHGTAYLIKSLLNHGRNDLVFQIVNQKTYPSWGYMLDQGATTLWEQWDGQNSLLHSSFVSIGSWFIEGIAGIRLDPTRPGYHHFLVQPAVVGDLTWAKGEYDTLYGTIRTDWKLSDGWLTLAVDVPCNTSATVFMPTQDPSSATESNHPAAESPGVRLQKTTDRAAVFQVGSGHYVFRARQKPTPSNALR